MASHASFLMDGIWKKEQNIKLLLYIIVIVYFSTEDNYHVKNLQ